MECKNLQVQERGTWIYPGLYLSIPAPGDGYYCVPLVGIDEFVCTEKLPKRAQYPQYSNSGAFEVVHLYVKSLE